MPSIGTCDVGSFSACATSGVCSALSKTLSVVVISNFGNVFQAAESEIRNPESERGPGGETRSLDSESFPFLVTFFRLRNPKSEMEAGSDLKRCVSF